MTNEDEMSGMTKDENLTDCSASSAHKEKSDKKERPTEEKKPGEEEIAKIEGNPDLEDPRLYSPLQEPDRPDPSLRTHEESEETEHEESQESSHSKE